ncbi:[acyl-carrier-protein] S-malonyltransferase [Tumebacillus algifaecis]|uniref:[acyl-carrier-protein] S-malonyltransferase n=1 Tax=Tumebacillus algifaecis TaxID=1214604 RepID=A0A223D1R1_9BACL|nr:ACP S-malonyltransferase [Tumebacillus algifaecis]ASS75395.1 [acyl-carrier-protein] S-malonyltransferase [Tumebacillus algifaecis]
MSKIAFVFPGQGSQFVGMGQALCEEHAIAREVFEEANEVLGFDLMKLCFEGSIEELTKTENAQAAILTHSVAAFRVFTQEKGIEPDFLMGHSLGEISALTCAGAISFRNAVRLVHQRGKFMQEAVAAGIGAMASIQNIDRQIVLQECERASSDGQVAVISNYNTPNQVVISGHSEAVAAICERLAEYGGYIVPLKVSAPFHSPLMNGAVVKFKEELSKCEFADLKWPVLSNVTARPYTDCEAIIDNLGDQIVSAVQWQDSVVYVEAQGVTHAIEFGPKKVLRNLIKNCTPAIKGFAYDLKEDRELLEQELQDLQANAVARRQRNLLTMIERCLAIAVCTKNYNPSDEEYQKGVLEPYQKIKLMKMTHEQDKGENLTLGEVNDAVHMLQSVFSAKRTPVSEQHARFEQIHREAGTRGINLDLKERAV